MILLHKTRTIRKNIVFEEMRLLCQCHVVSSYCLLTSLPDYILCFQHLTLLPHEDIRTRNKRRSFTIYKKNVGSTNFFYIIYQIRINGYIDRLCSKNISFRNIFSKENNNFYLNCLLVRYDKLRIISNFISRTNSCIQFINDDYLILLVLFWDIHHTK